MGRAIRVRHLRQGQSWAKQLCPHCFAEYSADARDYWNCKPETILTCNGNGSHRKRRIMLVRNGGYVQVSL